MVEGGCCRELLEKRVVEKLESSVGEQRCRVVLEKVLKVMVVLVRR